YQENHICTQQYLDDIHQYSDDYEKNDINDYPEDIKHNPDAQAFYSSLHDVLTEESAEYVTNQEIAMKEMLGTMAIDIEQAITEHVKVDWHENQDVKNNIELAIEELIFD